MSEIVIPNLPELQFAEDTHVYTLNGIEIPSVTTVMRALSYNEYWRVDEQTLERAARRGTAVHNSIENYFKFGFSDIDPELEGYLDGFMEWFQEYEPKIIGSEIRTYHRLFSYGGTLDLVAEINGELSLVDFKTTYRLIEKNCRVQL